MKLGYAIDPGINGVGLSQWALNDGDGILQKALYLPAVDAPHRLYGSACAVDLWLEHLEERWQDNPHFVIELPQVYQTANQKGRQSDIVDLAAVVGTLITLCMSYTDTVDLVHPSQWKAQLPKDVATTRILQRLSTIEQKRVELPAKTLQHNVYDSVGIGLHKFTRDRSLMKGRAT